MFEVQYLIYLYMLLCVAMIIFNWVYMMHNARVDKQIAKRDKKLMQNIDRQMNIIKANEFVSIKHQKYLEKKLSNTMNLYVLEETLNFYDKVYVERYIDEIRYVFANLCNIYIKKTAIEKAYFTYLLGKYEVFQNIQVRRIKAFIFKMLMEDSIYCIDNAWNTVCKIGNIEDIIKAAKIIDKKNNYENIDIILNGLKRYRGDEQDLCIILWKNFEQYSEKFKTAIIKYISLYPSDYWNEMMYEKLTDKKEKNEVKISIVEYFSKNIFERAKDELLNILNLNVMKNTEYIISAIKALKGYPGSDTIRELKKVLLKSQWNIQIVASETLNYLGANYLQLADIYNGENQTARRILRYINYREKRKEA